MLSSGLPIVSIIDLFRHVLQLDFEDWESRVYFNSLFDETIDELDAKSRELILYSLKLDIERKMEEQVKYFERFEKMRFKVRADPDKIALECFCRKCKFVPIQVSLILYSKKSTHASAYDRILTAKCPYCQTPGSLQFPILAAI